MAVWRVSGADNVVRALTVALVRSRFPNAVVTIEEAADEAARISAIGHTAWFAVVDDAGGWAAQAARAAGARAVITLGSSLDEIRGVLDLMESDRGPTDTADQPPPTSHGVDHGAVGGTELTRRESQVVELVVRGYSNREIAVELGISVHTVRTYLQTLTAKFGVSGRYRLAMRAVDYGTDVLREGR